MAASNKGFKRNVRGVRVPGIFSNTLIITDAQFRALPSSTTGLQIVPGPGLGKYLVPVMCVVENDWSTFYGNIDDPGSNANSTRIMIGWNTSPLTTAFRFVPIGPLAFGSTKKTSFSLPFDGSPLVDTAVDKAAYSVDFPFDGTVDRAENRAWSVLAANASGDFTLGDPTNTLTVTVWYLIRTFGYPL